MDYDPEAHHRRTLRLQTYEYAQAGAYFVTICTEGRVHLFGEVVEGEMRINETGRMVQDAWEEMPKRLAGVTLDQFVVMPNHFHGIVVLVGAQFIAPRTPVPNSMVRGAAQHIHTAPDDHPTVQGAMNCAPTLGWVIRTFKALSTKRIHLCGGPSLVWQRNYYEHIIRGERDLTAAREYILNNPFRGGLEQHNDDNAPDWD